MEPPDGIQPERSIFDFEHSGCHFEFGFMFQNDIKWRGMVSQYFYINAFPLRKWEKIIIQQENIFRFIFSNFSISKFSTTKLHWFFTQRCENEFLTASVTKKWTDLPFQCIYPTISLLSASLGVTGSPKWEHFCSLTKFECEKSLGRSPGKHLQWQKRKSSVLSNVYV